MVLKDVNADKHSSRRKILRAAAATKALQRRRDVFLPSNEFRFQEKESIETRDELERELEEIAKQSSDAIHSSSTLPPSSSTSIFDTVSTLGFDKLDDREAISMTCKLIGVSLLSCDSILSSSCVKPHKENK